MSAVEFLILTVWLIISIGVTFDAHDRDLLWPVWGLFTFFFGLIALAVYIVRVTVWADD